MLKAKENPKSRSGQRELGAVLGTQRAHKYSLFKVLLPIFKIIGFLTLLKQMSKFQ